LGCDCVSGGIECIGADADAGVDVDVDEEDADSLFAGVLEDHHQPIVIMDAVICSELRQILLESGGDLEYQTLCDIMEQSVRRDVQCKSNRDLEK
jgi:hypothetical protein